MCSSQQYPAHDRFDNLQRATTTPMTAAAAAVAVAATKEAEARALARLSSSSPSALVQQQEILGYQCMFTAAVQESHQEFFRRLSLTDAAYLYELAVANEEVLHPYCRVATGYFRRTTSLEGIEEYRGRPMHRITNQPATLTGHSLAMTTIQRLAHFIEIPCAAGPWQCTHPSQWKDRFVRHLIWPATSAFSQKKPAERLLIVALEADQIVVLVLEPADK